MNMHNMQLLCKIFGYPIRQAVVQLDIFIFQMLLLTAIDPIDTRISTDSAS